MHHDHIGEWLKYATRILAGSGIATARLDSLILLEDTLKKDRAYLLAHPELEIDPNSAKILAEYLGRREKHEPLAYIRGRSEFYGRDFLVTPSTLQPRPETETMIRLLLSLKLPKKVTLADVGTGSGALAITAKLELPHIVVHATEIQPDTLIVAQKNRDMHAVKVDMHAGNLLEPLMNTNIDVILANLPYVPDSHTINEGAMQEPAIAIFGGKDGLHLYREMFNQIQNLVHKPMYILAESLPFQHEELILVAQKSGYKLDQAEDFIQLFRAN